MTHTMRLLALLLISMGVMAQTTTLNFDTPRCSGNGVKSYQILTLGSPWDCEPGTLGSGRILSWYIASTRSATFKTSSPVVISSVSVGGRQTATFTLTTDQGEKITESTTSHLVQYATGFTKPSSTYTVTYSDGWYLQMDNIVYATTPPPVAVAISPTAVTLQVNGIEQFQSKVTNTTNTSVTWTAGSGAVTPSGLYTAPAAPGVDTVTVTSVADTTKSASAAVTISPIPVQHTATLKWTAGTPGSSGAAIAGYNVYRGTVTGGPYTVLNQGLVAALTFPDATVQSGSTYFYVVTSVDASKVESVYSSEVKGTIPTP